jgi:hypothetical protein
VGDEVAMRERVTDSDDDMHYAGDGCCAGGGALKIVNRFGNG